MGASTVHVPSSGPEAELPGGAPKEEVGGTGLELREEGRARHSVWSPLQRLYTVLVET